MTAPPPDSSAFAKAHDALLRQGDFQFSFPSFVVPKTPDWMKAVAHFARTHAAAVEWAVWTLGGAVVVFALYHLIRAYWPALSQWRPGRRHAPEKIAPEMAWRPTQAQARQLLKESDALAAQGLYADAVHLLLLRSIEDIQERRAGLVRPTLTSREIAMLRALPGPAREAFGGIATVVERGVFANLPIGREDFARCRRDYESFALPNWSAAA